MSLSASAPWLAFYGSTPASVDYPNCTMYQLVSRAAGQYPDHIAYVFQGRKTTYRAFMDRIELAAKGLYSLGIRKGQAVTICMPNSPQALDCFYALNRLGAIANVIHPLSAAGEIAFYLNTSKSTAILTLDQFYEKVAAVLPQVEQNCSLLVAKISEELPFPMKQLYPMTKAGRHPLPKDGYVLWRDVLRAGKKVNCLPADDGCADDFSVILYSGGTTGIPKGIMLSSRNFNALALQTIAASGFGNIAHMKMLSVMPIFHGFGLGIGIHTALVGGAACILLPQFSIKTYARTLLKEKPNIIPGVPTLFEAAAGGRAEEQGFKLSEGHLLRRRQSFPGAEEKSGCVPSHPRLRRTDPGRLRHHRMCQCLLPDPQGLPPGRFHRCSLPGYVLQDCHTRHGAGGRARH